MSERDLKPDNVPHDPLSVPCRICSAKPGQRCSTITSPVRYLEVPHFTRLLPERMRQPTLEQQLADMTAARDAACEIALTWVDNANLHEHHFDRERIAELRKVGAR